jgi:GntR family transcriptional regulator/GntR family frlABCD operon transcriptional regulator
VLSEAEKKAGYFFFERLRSVEQQPVMLELTYIPGMDIDDFLDKMSNVSLFSTLFRTYKIEVLKVLQDVRAVGAPAEVAKQLRLEPDEPLLHIHRKYLTTKPDFHIYSSLFCNTRKYALSNFFS